LAPIQPLNITVDLCEAEILYNPVEVLTFTVLYSRVQFFDPAFACIFLVLDQGFSSFSTQL